MPGTDENDSRLACGEGAFVDAFVSFDFEVGRWHVFFHHPDYMLGDAFNGAVTFHQVDSLRRQLQRELSLLRLIVKTG